MLTSWLRATALASLGLTAVFAWDEWDSQADAIVSAMTTQQLIGQMTQLDVSLLLNDSYQIDEDAVRKYARLGVGSYLNSPFSGGPENETYWWTAEEWREAISTIQRITLEENGGHPMIYGLDSVHGAIYVGNTIKFGQQINGGASFNPDLVYEMGRIAGRDTTAAGVSWIFGPILEITRNPLWARTYETFGEDPHLVATMADAIIRGMQSNNGTAACMKHFIGYSKTPNGHDRDAVTMTDFELLNYFMPSFLAAVDAGVLTAMENYVSVNGMPTIANPKLMNDLLRTDLGFEGFIVSDYGEINNLNSWHRVARDENEAVLMSLSRTTLDMSMVATDTSFINGTELVLDEYPQIVSRLRDSARRVVKTKLRIGLYDNPVPGEENIELVGNADDVAAALELARESIVLLQNNDSTLPLPTGQSVFLTGSSADDVGLQCGGWTTSWQGYSDLNRIFAHGITVKTGIESIVGNGSVTYFNGLYTNGSYSDTDLATAKQLASQAEYTIAVIGEPTYAEKPGDINDLALPYGQIEYVKELAATGTKVIVVLFEGRPRLLADLPENVHAIVHGLLACEQGGKAVAEILYGEVNPSGRLPITYPKDQANVGIPYNHYVSTKCSNGNDYFYCLNQWDFGTGLSYTTFNYSDLALSTHNVTSSSDAINVSVTVTNSGSVAGKETVMLFITQPFRSFMVPEVKMLKKFNKISLEAGESTTVSFTLTGEDWSVYYPQIGQGLKLVAEDADYVVSIKPETECNVYNSSMPANPLCATFNINTGEHPYLSLAPLM